jgi:hypothetical protein
MPVGGGLLAEIIPSSDKAVLESSKGFQIGDQLGVGFSTKSTGSLSDRRVTVYYIGMIPLQPSC